MLFILQNQKSKHIYPTGKIYRGKHNTTKQKYKHIKIKAMQTIYKQKVNSINTITVEIEKTFMNNYSVLCYDEENGIFIEKFADNYTDASKIADELFNKVCKDYF